MKNSGVAGVSLVAFGKHPGWDDHIPDIGAMTQKLIDVKRVLYVEGIGGSIDAGTWEKLDAGEVLEGFKHQFLWWTPEDVIVGRLWSSRDGKGRTRYPMVVCAQCQGLPLPWIINELLPRFEKFESSCAATTSAADVVKLLEQAQQEIDTAVRQANAGAASQALPPNLLARLADRPEMGQDRLGLLRIIYQLDREVKGQRGARTGAPGRARHIRVPACSDSSSGALLQWTQFLLSELAGAETPLLLVSAQGESWIDLILGDQVGSHISSIRVLPSKTPMTSQIPYSLDQPFIDQVQQRIAASRKGGLVTHQAASPSRSTSPSGAGELVAAQPGWSLGARLALAAAGVIFAVVVGMLVFATRQ